MIPLRKFIPRVAICLSKNNTAVARVIVVENGMSTAVHGKNGFVDLTFKVPASLERDIQGLNLVDLHESHTGLINKKEPYVIKQDESELDPHVPLYNCRIGMTSHMERNVPYPENQFDLISGYSMYSLSHAGRNNRYLYAGIHATHPSRHFSTSALSMSQGGQSLPFVDVSDPTPQGIQGDQCVSFKLWLENCVRYGLPSCDEQLHAVNSGRKTLAQVFAEQQELIKEVADTYSSGNMKAKAATQGAPNSTLSEHSPCPQGIQGDDCVRYKLWLENCRRFEFGDCDENIQAIQSGRKTLSQVFDEQDRQIKDIVLQYQQYRRYSATARDDKVGINPTPETPKPNTDNLNQKEKLKRAVRDYGATVIVFHVGISLVSLGVCYIAISSGIDMVGLLSKLGIGESILQSRAVAGASTFVIAYAVHKIFAPVRIGITLTCVPFIVRYLRQIGILKPPKSTQS